MDDHLSKDDICYPKSEIAKHFPYFDVLKDGRIHVLSPPLHIIPPSDDAVTGVKIKDVVISANVSLRIFLPTTFTTTTTRKRHPLLFYMHGSGYCMESPFSVDYTRYVGRLAAEAEVVAVSVKYGLFPGHPIPACYEDCMAAFQWVASHEKMATTSNPASAASSGANHDPWIKDHADLRQIFVAGDSAGGNIAHYLMSRVGSSSTTLLRDDVRVEGMFIVHPHFRGVDNIDEMWMYMCPTNMGITDPRLDPSMEDLAAIACGRVLVVVAEKDELRDAGKAYVEELITSGWKGVVQTVENKGKGHCFHIYQPHDFEALALQQQIVSFIKQTSLE